MKKNSLKVLNNYIYKALEELDNETTNETIKKCIAISTAGRTILSTINTEIRLIKLKESNGIEVDKIKESLGISDE